MNLPPVPKETHGEAVGNTQKLSFPVGGSFPYTLERTSDFVAYFFLSSKRIKGTGTTRIARQLGSDCGVCQQETAGEGPKPGFSVTLAAGWYGSACAPRPPVQHDTFECLEPTPRGEHGGRVQEVGACASRAGVAAR